ncbi:MAG: polymer-forming cytoskeletal protein [Pseudomonadota bacterium]
MGDTEIMKRPSWKKEEPAVTDSQVLSFNQVPESVRAAQDYINADRNTVVSVIGETLHFKGELSADEDLIIEGTVEGTIEQGACSLTLRPKGQIKANVNATKIFIEGTVHGDLHATDSVTVRQTGNVTGNIVAPVVAITEGATFNGSIEMRNPTDKKKPV